MLYDDYYDDAGDYQVAGGDDKHKFFGWYDGY